MKIGNREVKESLSMFSKKKISRKRQRSFMIFVVFVIGSRNNEHYCFTKYTECKLDNQFIKSTDNQQTLNNVSENIQLFIFLIWIFRLQKVNIANVLVKTV